MRPGSLQHGISVLPPIHHATTTVKRPSAWQRLLSRRVMGEGSFSQHYIFPDGELVPVSQANTIAELAGFELRDLENLREHYALTLRHWVQRLEANKAQAIQAAGEVTYRTWRLYLAASAVSFESGHINVNQSLLSKSENGQSHLPLSRADLYR